MGVEKVMGGGGTRRVRYAVIGLGSTTRQAVLPALLRCAEHAELAALVSGDSAKLALLGEQFGVERLYSFEEYNRCLNSGEIDAVYLAVPGTLYHEYAVRAAGAGVHVLCDKPFAGSFERCEDILRRFELSAAQLMVGYRFQLPFADPATLETAAAGQLGTLRIFNAVHRRNPNENGLVRRGVRWGSTYDVAIYCIAAARLLFAAEPLEVTAVTTGAGLHSGIPGDELSSATMRFPDDRVAIFTSGVGAADVSSYQLVGTEGSLVVDPAFVHTASVRHLLQCEGRSEERIIEQGDLFAAQIHYFSQCVLRGEAPQPSGAEALANMRCIEAIYRSAREGRPVALAHESEFLPAGITARRTDGPIARFA